MQRTLSLYSGQKNVQDYSALNGPGIKIPGALANKKKGGASNNIPGSREEGNEMSI